MNNIYIEGYKRITKATARKLYNAGAVIRLTACNMSPVSIWGCYVDAQKESVTTVSKPSAYITTVARNKEFDTVITAFTYYNCNRETGLYPAYYIKEV